jgi:alpha-N-arabinofuranosidase
MFLNHLKRISMHLSLVVLFAIAFGASARTIHVAKTGNNSNTGDSLSPYLTVSQAAQVAQAGDEVAIHAGTYREYINPPRGGSSETARITYRPGLNEKVIITGAEPVTGWVDQGNNVWKATLAPSFFGSAVNPYAAYLTHDQFMSYGLKRHPGDVYLNDSALAEDTLLSQVSTKPFSWFCQMSGTNTEIYANFSGANPNTQNTEINVREMVFYPTTSGLSYITVQGLQLEKAALNWTPCCSGQQHGLIGVNGGNYWTIENCVIRYARSVGITLKGGSGTNMAAIGHFIVRNCIIQRCGQSGICGGQSGHSTTQIIGNLIEDTNYKYEFGGAETAALKFHFAIDFIIRNNCIRRVKSQPGDIVGNAIWLDYCAQNVRISSNVIYDIAGYPIYCEVTHGPVLIDNNVLARRGQGAYNIAGGNDGLFLIHNLIEGLNMGPASGDGRSTPYYQPHSKTSMGSSVETGSDHKYLNNIFMGGGFQVYQSFPGFVSDYNALYGAGATGQDAHSVSSSTNTNFLLTSTPTSVSISFNLADTAFKRVQCPLLTSSYIGKASLPNMYAENPDASPITFNRDYFGNSRNASRPTVGPFEDLKPGVNSYTLFSTQGDIVPVGTHEAIPHSRTSAGFRSIGSARYSVVGTQDGSIVIADAMGKVVRQNRLRAAGEQRIVGDGLPAGVYVAKLIVCGRTIDALRFVKSRG